MSSFSSHLPVIHNSKLELRIVLPPLNHPTTQLLNGLLINHSTDQSLNFFLFPFSSSSHPSSSLLSMPTVEQSRWRGIQTHLLRVLQATDSIMALKADLTRV